MASHSEYVTVPGPGGAPVSVGTSFTAANAAPTSPPHQVRHLNPRNSDGATACAEQWP